MKKRVNYNCFHQRWWRKKVEVTRKCLLLFLLSFTSAVAFAQQKVNLDVKDQPLLKVLNQLQEQSDYTFLFTASDVENVTGISVKAVNEDLFDVLRKCLRGTNLTFEVSDKLIVLKQLPPATDTVRVKSLTVKGFVYDEKKQSMPGVTVKVAGVAVGTATNENGWFSLSLPLQKGFLEFSFVGYKKQQVAFMERTDTLKIFMEEEAQDIDEVVVTGIFNRAKESFTGAVTTFTKDEIQTHFSRNLIQTLSNLDPSLRIIANNAAGSNPNVLPELQLRGASTMLSVEEIQNGESNYELNQPLFIMDGFEVSLERVMDLNDDEVENITVLKDASATALYGSRGANGVIVITSVRPKPGKIGVSYSGKVKFEIPDLSTYDDLTNAVEKLELEKIYGLWDDPDIQEIYDSYKAAADEGLNYNWLDEPLRTGIGQQHTLNIMGGVDAWRFRLDLFYDTNIGVMDGSDRKNFNGSMEIDYVKGKWNVRQLLTIGLNEDHDSPYGDYSYYVRMNRYWKPYDENGDLIEQYYHPNATQYIDNPMYDKEVGCWNESKYTSLRSTTQARFDIAPSFQLNFMLGLTKKLGTQDSFIPPTHKYFADEENIEQKGEYSRGENVETSWETRLTLNYSKVFREKHMLTVGLAGEMSATDKDQVSWSATGFLTSETDHIGSSLGYRTTGGTMGYQSTSRRVSLSGFVNYYYDMRYFVDLTYRADGSSSFGKNSRFSPFYALGFGWTISKEEFIMEHVPFVSMLQLRYSYGVSGNMAFSPEQALEVFNRETSYSYNGGVGVYMSTFANPNLKQQNTYQHNAGLTLGLFDNKINVVVNYYNKLTDNALTDIYLPISHGFEMVKGNVGKIRNSGYDGSVNFSILKTDDFSWNTVVSFSHNKEVLVELSEGFKESMKYYDTSMSSATEMLKYREGHSMTAIYGLRTLGVDPLSGQRIFLTKEGGMTLYQNGEDLVYLGDSQPKVNGSVNMTFSYKGLSLSCGMGVQWGGYAENYTELNKRENLNLTYNVDRQVLIDGWQKPGDEALYKRQGINVMNTYPCDMFVHKNNTFNFNSINIRYKFPYKLIKKWGLQSLSIGTELSDIMYFSTIHRERGTSYPYSKNPNFTISCTF